MSDIKTIIKYDGPSVDQKQMDVADLAPSLLSLSDLIKDVNRKFNGNRATIKVYVNADLEQNCFELIVHVSQTLLDSLTVLISDYRVIQAKEILEWIGIITGGSTFVGVTLYKLIKFLNGKKVTSVAKVKIKDHDYEILIKAVDKEGNPSDISVLEMVYELYSSYLTRKRAIDVLAPLKNQGYDRIQFHDGKKVYEEFKKPDLPSIEECPEVVPSNVTHSEIKTVVRIRKPAYEGTSKWTLVYERAIDASIDDDDWLNRFQSNEISAPPNSSLEVDMIKEVVVNEFGEALDEPIYRIIKVHKVILPPDQMSLL